MLKILIISIVLAKVLVFEKPFKLPDVKPFNCIPCFSFWLAIVFGSIHILTLDIYFVQTGLKFFAWALLAYYLGTLIIKKDL